MKIEFRHLGKKKKKSLDMKLQSRDGSIKTWNFQKKWFYYDLNRVCMKQKNKNWDGSTMILTEFKWKKKQWWFY